MKKVRNEEQRAQARDAKGSHCGKVLIMGLSSQGHMNVSFTSPELKRQLPCRQEQPPKLKKNGGRTVKKSQE